MWTSASLSVRGIVAYSAALRLRHKCCVDLRFPCLNIIFFCPSPIHSKIPNCVAKLQAFCLFVSCWDNDVNHILLVEFIFYFVFWKCLVQNFRSWWRRWRGVWGFCLSYVFLRHSVLSFKPRPLSIASVTGLYTVNWVTFSLPSLFLNYDAEISSRLTMGVEWIQSSKCQLC